VIWILSSLENGLSSSMIAAVRYAAERRGYMSDDLIAGVGPGTSRTTSDLNQITISLASDKSLPWNHDVEPA